VSLLRGLLGLLLVLGLQGALAPHLAIAGVPPDLGLVAVLVVALDRGPGRGAAAGLAVGFGLDLLRGSRLGTFALAAAAAGWVCGEVGTRLDPGRPFVRWLLTSICAGGYGLCVAGLALVLDRDGIHATGALRHVLVAAVYDGSLATLAYGVHAAVWGAGPTLRRAERAARWRLPAPAPRPRRRTARRRPAHARGGA
jgi:rod shape-determining protein MreD